MGSRKAVPKQGESAREKLIEAGLELFSEYGFAEAPVRDIAKRAGQNIGSITYYFGDKKGLYTAVAETIVAEMQSQIGDGFQEIEEKLQHGPLLPEEYLEYLKKIIGGMLVTFVQGSPHRRRVSQIFAREQLTPTHVAELLYNKIHAPMHRLFCQLIGGYLGKDADSPEILVRSYAIFGSALIFSMARNVIGRRTGWKSIGDQQLRLVASIVSEHIDLILSGLHGANQP